MQGKDNTIIKQTAATRPKGGGRGRIGGVRAVNNYFTLKVTSMELSP